VPWALTSKGQQLELAAAVTEADGHSGQAAAAEEAGGHSGPAAAAEEADGHSGPAAAAEEAAWLLESMGAAATAVAHWEPAEAPVTEERSVVAAAMKEVATKLARHLT